MRIDTEREGDAPALSALIAAAFAGHPHSSGTEAAIVARLRDSGALDLSLVARGSGRAIIGQIAFSSAFVDGQDRGLKTLGPLAVDPQRQGAGIGSALVREGLARIEGAGATGCVVVGDPAYYARFGFEQAKAGALYMPGPFERERFLGLELRAGALAGAEGALRATGAFEGQPEVAAEAAAVAARRRAA